jgi:hypothetical protein
MDDITSEALAFLKLPSPDKGAPPFVAALRHVRDPGLVRPDLVHQKPPPSAHPCFALLDSIAGLRRHKSIRYMAALDRLSVAAGDSGVSLALNRTGDIYDRAVLDMSLRVAVDEERKRLEFEAELAECTFQPATNDDQRREEHDFFDAGQKFLFQRKKKIEKKQREITRDAEEADEERARAWKPSKGNQAVLDAVTARASEAAVASMRSDGGDASESSPRKVGGSRRSAYVDPCTFHPAVSPRSTVVAVESRTTQGIHGTSVFSRLASQSMASPRSTPHSTPRARSSPRGTPQNAPRVVFGDTGAMKVSVDRLHRAAPKVSPGAGTYRRPATEGLEYPTFRPEINDYYVPEVRDSPRRRRLAREAADDDEATAEVMVRAPQLTRDETDMFYLRQAQWHDDVRDRAYTERRRRQDATDERCTFSPRISPFAAHMRIGDSYAQSVRREDVSRLRSPNSAAKRAATPRRTTAMHPLTPRVLRLDDSASLAAYDPAVGEDLRTWFRGLDVSGDGVVRSADAYAALLEFAATLGVAPQSIDVAAEFAERCVYSDFVLMFARVVPL